MSEEPFLKRWSRRKVEAREGPKPGDEPAAAEEAKVAALDSRSERGDVEPAAGPQEKGELTEADFADVDFDALDAKSDYSRFLEAGVPESIKNKALRQLWMSDALYTTPDPFQDYLHDYTDAAVAVPPGTLKTAYRIGKGYLTDEEVAEWEKLGKPAEATNDATAGAKPAEGSQAAAAATSIGFEPQIAVAPEPADQPEVHALLRQSDVYHAALYPAESNHLVDVAKLSSPNVRFVVARRDGIAAGCGALILGVDGEAELKRMFVAPEARGQKIGARMLQALEASAKAEGVRIIRLETGVRQPESLALYRRHGYTERGPFGTYQRDPLSTFFEKWIG